MRPAACAPRVHRGLGRWTAQTVWLFEHLRQPDESWLSIRRPPVMTAAGSANPALHARSRGTRSLMHQPLLLPEHPIHGFLVHAMERLATAAWPLDADSRTWDVAESIAGAARPRAALRPQDVEDQLGSDGAWPVRRRTRGSVAFTRRMSSGLKGGFPGFPQHVGIENEIPNLLLQFLHLLVLHGLLIHRATQQGVLGPVALLISWARRSLFPLIRRYSC
jgi:hypothetical protein